MSRLGNPGTGRLFSFVSSYGLLPARRSFRGTKVLANWGMIGKDTIKQALLFH